VDCWTTATSKVIGKIEIGQRNKMVDRSLEDGWQNSDLDNKARLVVKSNPSYMDMCESV
jgi:hypothetical protein